MINGRPILEQGNDFYKTIGAATVLILGAATVLIFFLKRFTSILSTFNV